MNKRLLKELIVKRLGPYLEKVAVLRYWIMGRGEVTLGRELLNFLTTKEQLSRSKSIIKSYEETEDYLEVYFKGLEWPLYYPKQFSLNSLAVIGNEILNSKHWHYYEIAETRVQPNDVVVDCGAAEGLFALTVAGRCKNVYVVEPHPIYVKSLVFTFKHFDNVFIIPKAVSEVEGTAFLLDNGPLSKVEESGYGIPVKMSTVDYLFSEIEVNYIKADLEGYELNMLKGSQNVIKRCCPKLAIASYHNRKQAQSIVEFIQGLGLNYKIKGKGIHPWNGVPYIIHAWVE